MNQAMEKFYWTGIVAAAFALGWLQKTNLTTAKAAVPQQAPADSVAVVTDKSGVIFVSNDQVSKAYAKGALLYDGYPDRNYRVNVFHRDKPGEVEIHTKDTDIFYILEGSATLATGGTMMGGKETAPGEVRGPSMTGGEVRHVTKGDVIIIPANVAHCYTAVEQPTTYFGVKVR